MHSSKYTYHKGRVVFAALLALVLLREAGAATIEPVIFANRETFANVTHSHSRDYVMIQPALSLVDVGFMPETSPHMVVEEIGPSGAAGLLVIWIQDTETASRRVVPPPHGSPACEWIHSDRARGPPNHVVVADDVDEQQAGFIEASRPHEADRYVVPPPGRRGSGSDRHVAVAAGPAGPNKPFDTPGRITGRMSSPRSDSKNRARTTATAGPAEPRADARKPMPSPRPMDASPTVTSPKMPVISPGKTSPGNVQALPSDPGELHAIVFEGNSGNLSAKVLFWQEGTQLKFQLFNMSGTSISAEQDVLTALFFTVANQPTLTPVSVVLAAGSTILRPVSLPPDGVSVGGEWAYKHATVKSIGLEYGVSVTQYNGIFGQTNRFPGPIIGGNGNNFSNVGHGLIGPGGTSLTKFPLISSSVIFTLDGLPETFDLLTDIMNVWFQYGPSHNSPYITSIRIIQEWEEEIINPPPPPDPPDPPEPPVVPEPMTLCMLLLGSACLLCRRERAIRV